MIDYHSLFFLFLIGFADYSSPLISFLEKETDILAISAIKQPQTMMMIMDLDILI
jgi:hypothetical protein